MICGFKNKYTFLSNFYPVKVEYKGIIYDNAESAYQAQKCKNVNDKAKFIGIDGATAKKLGRNIEVIDGWDSFKHQIMFEIVYQKFIQNDSIAERLIATGKEMIIETNYWHDNYWGNCECENCKDISGMNNLGFILMHVRYILQNNVNTEIENVKNDAICPYATSFSYPRCMSFNKDDYTCSGKYPCKKSPFYGK